MNIAEDCCSLSTGFVPFIRKASFSYKCWHWQF